MDTPIKNTLEELIDSSQAYTKTTFELSKLKGINSLANVSSILVANFCLIIISTLFLIILSIGIALLLNELLGNPYYGFFILSGFYLVVIIVFYFFLNDWIKKPFSNLIISQILD